MRRIGVVCIVTFSVVLGFVTLRASLPLVASGSWQPAANMTVARSGATSVALPDGRILITGGRDVNGNPIASAEVMNVDGTFSAVAPMSIARHDHAAILLATGDVLVTGGRTAGGGITNAAEIYDPLANTWQSVNSMSDARARHTLSQLLDGTVLVAGGENSAGPLGSLEIFDITKNTFSAVATLANARTDHAAATLNDGRVLISGGTGVAADGSAVILNSTEIFDPAALGSSAYPVSAGPALNTARANHSATTLLDGNVLIAGGSGPATAPATGLVDLASAELFDSNAGTITALSSSMATARSGHLAFLLPNNNNVIIAGGTSNGNALASAESYVPWTQSFQSAGAMTSARTAASGAPLSTDGLLLVSGGQNASNSALNTSELYGFATVKTDQPDYAPGQTVNISGSGWQPGETVTLTFVESPNIDSHPPLTAIADANGNIFNNQFVPDSHDIGVVFFLTATGSLQQAQTTFRDGNLTYSPASKTFSNVPGGSAVSFSQTVTSPNGAGPFTATLDAKGTGTLLMPSSWVSAAPSTLSFAGTGDSQTWTITITVPANTAAGTYTGKVTANPSIKGVGEGSGTSVSVTVPACTAPAISVQPASQTVTYGQSATFSVTASGTAPLSYQWSRNGSPISGATSSSYSFSPVVSDSGSSYTVQVSNACGSVTSAPAATLTVNKATPSISGSQPSAITYGTTMISLSGTVGPANLIPTGTVSVSINGNSQNATYNSTTGAFTISYDAHAIPASTTPYQITYTFTPDSTSSANFNSASDASETLTINLAPLTITAKDGSKTYGQTLSFAGTEFTSSGLLNSDTVSGVTLTSAGAAATAGVAGSPYAIVPSAAQGSGLSNYTIAYVNGKLTVDPAPLTITAKDASKTYGQTLSFAGTEFTSSGLLNSDTVSGVTLTSAGAAATAGVAGSPYAIVASAAQGTGLGSYTITYADGKLTVNPAPLVVTPDNQEKMYGPVFSNFTGSLVTVLNNDGITASYASSGSAATASVGNYDITATLSDPNNRLGNYSVTLNKGTLKVDPAPLNITANDASKTYGQTLNFAGTEFSSSGLLNSDTVTSVTLASAGAVATAGVSGSPYAIVPSAAQGTGLGNYIISYFNGKLTVNPAPLTITSNNATRIYGAPDNSTWTYTGLVAGETQSVNSVSTPPACGAGDSLNTPVGTYTITCSSAVSTNYTISYANTGILTITQASTATVVVSSVAPSVFGQPVSFTAMVSDSSPGSTGTPTGTVQFSIDGTPYAGTVTAGAQNGNLVATIATSSLAVSAGHTIGAVYAGDHNFTGSAAANIMQPVNKASTRVSVASSLPTSILNQAVTYTATIAVVAPGAGTPTGTVTFYVDSTSGTQLGAANVNGTGSYSIVSSAVPVNSHSIIAAYTGDGNFNGASGSATQIVQYATGGLCYGATGHQVLSPINSDGSSVFKQGSTVPVKFRVCDANGNSIGTPGVVTSFTALGAVSGTAATINETITSTTPDTAFRWDSTNQQWIFNVGTKNWSSNTTYIFTIVLNDGTMVGPVYSGMNLASGNSSFQFGLK